MIQKTRGNNHKIFDIDAQPVLSEYNEMVCLNRYRGCVFFNTIDVVEKIFMGKTIEEIVVAMSNSNYSEEDVFVKVRDNGSLFSSNKLRDVVSVKDIGAACKILLDKQELSKKEREKK